MNGPMLKPTGTLMRALDDKITIERGIPIPPAGGRPRRGVHLAVQRAMETMEIGESFLLPPVLDTKAVLSIAKGVKQQTGRRFATRSCNEDGRDVVRVWRDE